MRQNRTGRFTSRSLSGGLLSTPAPYGPNVLIAVRAIDRALTGTFSHEQLRHSMEEQA